jgi:hypothetical protein
LDIRRIRFEDEAAPVRVHERMALTCVDLFPASLEIVAQALREALDDERRDPGKSCTRRSALRTELAELTTIVGELR